MFGRKQAGAAGRSCISISRGRAEAEAKGHRKKRGRDKANKAFVREGVAERVVVRVTTTADCTIGLLIVGGEGKKVRQLKPMVPHVGAALVGGLLLFV